MPSRLNGRKSGGFSLREALYSQGVTTTEELNKHLNKVKTTLDKVPTLDITRYRTNRSGN